MGMVVDEEAVMVASRVAAVMEDFVVAAEMNVAL